MVGGIPALSNLRLAVAAAFGLVHLGNDRWRLWNVLAEDVALEEVWNPYFGLVRKVFLRWNGEHLWRNV